MQREASVDPIDQDIAELAKEEDVDIDMDVDTPNTVQLVRLPRSEKLLDSHVTGCVSFILHH